ncbi:MAG TPA: class I SAM-dependent methyltransferase [Marmoricola sp.]|nr:class I SAM-dependent methyltransferase [Marmoricola sp.]
MSDQPPLLIRHLLGMYAMDTLAMGRVSGALDALAQSPGTVADVAARARLDERNTDLWLRAMAAAGHATHDRGTFTLNPETASLLGPAFPIDLGAVLDFVHAAFAEPLQLATDAMRTGEGVASSHFAELAASVGSANSRVYGAALVDEWVAAVPGLADRLAAGGRIADVACGNGDAAAVMAGAFPASHVFGFDPGAPEGAHAGLANLEIVRDVAAVLPADGSFDLVTCLDSFHHLGDVGAVARQVHDALGDGGVFLIAETALSGDIDADNADPFSLIAHASALMYCMQENIASGGDGATPSVGLGWVTDALTSAGFSSVETLDSETGYRVFLATR